MDVSWIPTVGYSGLGVLVVAWLLVSFSAPGPRRAILEWVGACGMYVALLMLFAHLLGRSLAADSIAGKIGFGFLVVFFTSGLVLCVVNTLLALREPSKSLESSTH
jgi:hypothetical protein